MGILLLGTSFHLSNAKAAYFPPEVTYQTIQTDHFRIHHPQERVDQGLMVAELAEEMYHLIGEEFNVYPFGKVTIVLTDDHDEANGSASPIPYNTILLRLVPPEAESTLAFYDDWLRLLLVHEYTHIIHLSDAGYPAKLLKFLLGKLVAPNALSPRWVIEGLATFYESAATESGRGRSTFTQMLLRTDLYHDRFLKLDRMGGNIYDWPGGRAAYLYGVAFWKYLADTYGREKLTQFSHKYGASLWLFSLNNKAKRVFGKSFHKLWKDWKQSLEEETNRIKEHLEAEGIVEGHPIASSDEESYTSPAWDHDGKQLAYVVTSVHHKTEVRLREGEKERRLFRHKDPSGLAWSPDGNQLAFTAIRTHKRYYRYSDLYLYSLEAKTKRALTQGKRVRDPAFSPDGQRIAVSQYDGSRDRLALYDLESEKLVAVGNTAPNTRIAHLSWHPREKLIAASVWHPGGHRDIVVFSSEGDVVRRITEDHAVDLQPVWSRDGRHLYFSSDRSGIPNLYQYDWERATSTRLTRVLTGAFAPESAPSGSNLTFQYYNGRGYEIREIDVTQGIADNGTAEHITSLRDDWQGPVRTVTNTEDRDFTSRPYSPWSTALLPHYIRPGFLILDNALYVAGLIGSVDPLLRHHWQGMVSYRSDANFVGFGAAYQYTRYRPHFFLGINDAAVNFGDIFGTGNDFFEERLRGFGGIALPIFGNQRVSAQYFFEDRSAESVIPTMPPLTPVLGQFAGFRLGYRVSQQRALPASVSPEESYWLRLDFDITDSALGASDNMERQILAGDMRQYVLMPWSRHHVLALRQAGGFAFGDQLTQGTFALGGAIGESPISSTSNRVFTLRGIPLSTFVRDRALVFSAEYRMPLFSAQRGLGTLPLFLKQASIAFFADYGDAWNKGGTAGGLDDFFDSFLLGVGAELRGHFVVGYHVPIMGRLGYGRIVVNEGRISGLSGEFLGNVSNGVLILQLGTSF